MMLKKVVMDFGFLSIQLKLHKLCIHDCFVFCEINIVREESQNVRGHPVYLSYMTQVKNSLTAYLGWGTDIIRDTTPLEIAPIELSRYPTFSTFFFRIYCFEETWHIFKPVIFCCKRWCKTLNDK